MVAFGITSLLQTDEDVAANKRPRDCTCITGMKTYPTTPRDELLGMGTRALHGKLDSCKRNLEGLEEQKDYAIADMEVKVKKADEQMADAQKALDRYADGTAANRADDKAEKVELKTSVDDLGKKTTELNGEYNKEYSTWFDLKKEMTAKLGKMESCNCQQAFFLQRAHVSAPAPSPEMYDTASKVEDCETQSLKVSKEIENAQAKGREATIKAIENRKQTGRRMADSEQMHKVLSQKDQVKLLSKTKSHLEQLVKQRKDKVDHYKKVNADIRKQLDELDSNMKKCGC
jgi:hypothetical protein